MKAAPFLFALLLAATWSPVARAENVCDGMQMIMSDASNQFKASRSGFNFERDHYRGRITLGDLSQCSTEASQGQATYTCESGDLPHNEAPAKALAEEVIAELQACFGNTIRRRPHARANVARFEYRPTNDSIQVKYRCSVPRRGDPYCSVSLEVLYIDDNVPRRNSGQ